jgi:DNA-binding response OmpR family regulator
VTCAFSWWTTIGLCAMRCDGCSRSPATRCRPPLAHSVIYDRVWGYDFGAASNALRVCVGYLRRKLQEIGARELIHTVRGVGYVMREP